MRALIEQGPCSMRARIVATGSAVPRRILRNSDLERMVATSGEWIVGRTGIRERRIVDDGVASSDLGTDAARAALAASGWDPADLDLILVATCTPDMPLPSTACLIQRNLKASRAIAFDLAAACSGFLYGLSVADLYVRSGTCRRVLLVGDRKSTRLNSSHLVISYAVFCLKKKKKRRTVSCSHQVSDTLHHYERDHC